MYLSTCNEKCDKILDTVIIERPKKEFTFSGLRENILYLPKNLEINKENSKMNYEVISLILSKALIKVEWIDCVKKHSLSKQEENALVAFLKIFTNIEKGSDFSSKEINRALSYCVFKNYLFDGSMDQFKDKKTNSEFIKCLQAIIVKNAESLIVKKACAYIKKNGGKLWEKAFKYRLNGVRIFNYEELLRIFSVKEYKILMKEFNISKSKPISEFFEKARLAENIESEIEKWNAPVKVLLETSFMEYFKLRVNAFRKQVKLHREEYLRNKIKGGLIPYITRDRPMFEFDSRILNIVIMYYKTELKDSSKMISFLNAFENDNKGYNLVNVPAWLKEKPDLIGKLTLHS
jgi:hypothetical protein